ncbi:MAG: hypothetical protein ACERKZ_01050 [Lachnotalea sp.]
MDKKIPALAGLNKVFSDDVMLKPALIVILNRTGSKLNTMVKNNSAKMELLVDCIDELSAYCT